MELLRVTNSVTSNLEGFGCNWFEGFGCNWFDRCHCWIFLIYSSAFPGSVVVLANLAVICMLASSDGSLRACSMKGMGPRTDH